MVDRVGNGPGYNYSQVNERKVNSGATGTGEKFQFDYGKEGAIYEPSSEALKKQQEEKKAVPRVADASKEESEGVRLTLSGTAVNHSEEAKQAGEVQPSGILDTVTNIVNKVIDTIMSFFNSLWNETPTAENTDIKVENDNAVTKPKTRFEQAKVEAEAFLASTEGKKVAKNSDLLTYYDKHGTVVSMSPSDKQRILYGDRNQIEV